MAVFVELPLTTNVPEQSAATWASDSGALAAMFIMWIAGAEMSHHGRQACWTRNWPDRLPAQPSFALRSVMSYQFLGNEQRT
jgi:hypothetical protein